MAGGKGILLPIAAVAAIIVIAAIFLMVRKKGQK